MSTVKIPYAVARQIAEHAARQLPDEACGLLAGARDHIEAAYPARNAAERPRTRFLVDPHEQLQALKAIDAAGLEWIGVYHSHPCGAPIPSKTDVEDCVDSGLLQLIVSLERTQPRLKLWRIARHAVDPIELVYATETPPEEPALSPAQQAAVVLVAIAALLLLLIISFSLLPPAPDILPAN